MGTSWTVRLVLPAGLDEPTIRATILAALDGVTREMSTWEPDSAISRYNAATPGTWHDLPDGFATVLGCAVRIAEASGGAFDPTIGPAAGLWGFGPLGPAPRPDAPAVARERGRIGWTRLRRENGRLLQPGGIELDLSGIAKGYAVDRVTDDLIASGIASLLVEIGGELRGQGVKPDLSPWWVALERPPDAPASLPETGVALHGLSVATSGDYRRFAGEGLARYSHTIDPRTGAPVDGTVASVSVLHRSCMEADALATALTVLGLEEGMSFATRHDVPALFLERAPEGLREHGSPALVRLAG